MNFIITLLILFIILGIIVGIHEFGHFIAAKKAGVHVYEFSIGMGPKIFSFNRKNDETLYSIRILPIGGFNALASEAEGRTDVSKNKILENKSYFKRFTVLIMGIVFNVLLAILLLFINGLIYGSPETRPIVGEVAENKAADKAGIISGDQIIEVDGKSVKSWDDIIIETTYASNNESYIFTVLRDELKIKVTINPEISEDEEGNRKVTFGVTKLLHSEKGLIPALKYAFVGSYQSVESIFNILIKLFTGKISTKNLSGPIGVYSVIDQVKETGLERLVYLTAYLSINVGVINFFPIPAFDGGRLLLLLIESIKRKKLNPKVENIINNIGTILIILLIIYVAINDILRLI